MTTAALATTRKLRQQQLLLQHSLQKHQLKRRHDSTLRSTIKVTNKACDAEKRAVDRAKDADQKVKDAGKPRWNDKAQKAKKLKRLKKLLKKNMRRQKKLHLRKSNMEETNDVDAKKRLKRTKTWTQKNKGWLSWQKSDEAKRAKGELDKGHTGAASWQRAEKTRRRQLWQRERQSSKEKEDADKNVLVNTKPERDAETRAKKQKKMTNSVNLRKSERSKNKSWWLRIKP